MSSEKLKSQKRSNRISRVIITFFLIICILLMVNIIKNINNIHQKEEAEKKYIESIKSYEDQNDMGYNDISIEESIPNNYKISYDSLQESETMINNNNSYSTNNEKTGNIGDCIIEIPDINLSKIVYTGDDRERHLENYEFITAANDMQYSQGGNYIICGHASRLYGHSLNRIREITKGTKISIINSNHTDKYIVNKVYYVNMNDTDKYCLQNSQRELTIISCAKYISKESYIVVKAIPKY